MLSFLSHFYQPVVMRISGVSHQETPENKQNYFAKKLFMPNKNNAQICTTPTSAFYLTDIIESCQYRLLYSDKTSVVYLLR